MRSPWLPDHRMNLIIRHTKILEVKFKGVPPHPPHLKYTSTNTKLKMAVQYDHHFTHQYYCHCSYFLFP